MTWQWNIAVDWPIPWFLMVDEYEVSFTVDT
jgi:hypothetical protein